MTADAYSERAFGGPTFGAFEPSSAAHRAAAEALHDRLVAIGFGPHDAAALFGLAELTDVRPARVAFYDAHVLPDTAAGRAARFFVLHVPATDGDLRAWLGADIVRFLADMAAIVAVDGGWRSIVSITWIAGKLVLADARAYNVIWPGEPAADYVMPPGGDSLGLVRVAPQTPRRRTLDLCCGSGVQALAAAAYSDEVVGVDVNPRALRFARVNAAANRVERATFLLGDTYAPIGAERFDAILSNPPFVPWPADERTLLFRGGGPRGEDVIERILRGASAHLHVPGVLAIVADFADVNDLGTRVAGWQGERLRTLLLLQRQHVLLEYAERHAAHLPDGPEQKAEVLRLLAHYGACNLRTLDFGYLLQDGAPGGTHIVRTTTALAAPIAADVAAWFAHQRRFARGGINDAVLQLAPELRLVRETTRSAGAAPSESYRVEPGPASMLPAKPVSAMAYALLERIAEGTLRPREMDDIREVNELALLLDGGWVRIQE